MNISPTRKGLLYGFFAFFSWGFVPIFWKQLPDVPPVEILCHRLLWGTIILLIFLKITKKYSHVAKLWNDKNKRRTIYYTTFLIITNWLIYLWAVLNNYIVETGLGYFINPLFNVLLGVFVLKERLRSWQWISVLFAFIGIMVFVANGVGKPWIALALAGLFGCYGLLRKKYQIESLPGLYLESVLGLAPFLIYAIYLELNGLGHFIEGDAYRRFLLIVGGLVSITPLLAFGKAVQYLNLTTVGLMQYIAPSMHVMAGVFLYHEEFGKTHMFAFMFIWIGVIIFSIEALINNKKIKN